MTASEASTSQIRFRNAVTASFMTEGGLSDAGAESPSQQQKQDQTKSSQSNQPRDDVSLSSSRHQTEEASIFELHVENEHNVWDYIWAIQYLKNKRIAALQQSPPSTNSTSTSVTSLSPSNDNNSEDGDFTGQEEFLWNAFNGVNGPDYSFVPYRTAMSVPPEYDRHHHFSAITQTLAQRSDQPSSQAPRLPGGRGSGALRRQGSKASVVMKRHGSVQ